VPDVEAGWSGTTTRKDITMNTPSKFVRKSIAAAVLVGGTLALPAYAGLLGGTGGLGGGLAGGLGGGFGPGGLDIGGTGMGRAAGDARIDRPAMPRAGDRAAEARDTATDAKAAARSQGARAAQWATSAAQLGAERTQDSRAALSGHAQNAFAAARGTSEVPNEAGAMTHSPTGGSASSARMASSTSGSATASRNPGAGDQSVRAEGSAGGSASIER
jgi:hypothetical protein